MTPLLAFVILIVIMLAAFFAWNVYCSWEDEKRLNDD